MTTLSKAKIKTVIDILMEYYPDADCALNHNSPYELLIATILSAQCTDVRVNIITEELFKVANSPQAMLELGEESLKDYIKSAGFFNTKGKNILETSRILVENYNGEVPNDRAALESLPGVGRKTANVVLSKSFGVPAIAVDTHVFRVSNRIGLVEEKTVEKTEDALMKAIPKTKWTKMHHVIIFHGRQICKARSPLCDICPINHICKFINK